MKELFEIIPKLPGVRVYHFAKERQDCKELEEFCQEKGHYLEVAALTQELFEELQPCQAKVRYVPETKERYNQRSQMFDTVFVTYDITKLHDLEQFLRKIYRMMKNAADLILIVDKEQQEALQRLLEEVNYVAINPIETGDKVALTAKKMHGWARV